MRRIWKDGKDGGVVVWGAAVMLGCWLFGWKWRALFSLDPRVRGDDVGRAGEGTVVVGGGVSAMGVG